VRRECSDARPQGLGEVVVVRTLQSWLRIALRVGRGVRWLPMGALGVVAAGVARLGDPVGMTSVGAQGCAQIGSLGTLPESLTGETDMKPSK
jgi:hypothetical protein